MTTAQIMQCTLNILTLFIPSCFLFFQIFVMNFNSTYILNPTNAHEWCFLQSTTIYIQSDTYFRCCLFSCLQLGSFSFWLKNTLYFYLRLAMTKLPNFCQSEKSYVTVTHEEHLHCIQNLRLAVIFFQGWYSHESLCCCCEVICLTVVPVKAMPSSTPILHSFHCFFGQFYSDESKYDLLYLFCLESVNILQSIN